MMITNFLEKVFEHNNWANLQIIQACSTLTDEQLDAEPQSATQGSIRSTLVHLAAAQHGYLKLLTLPLDQRDGPTAVEFADVSKSMRTTGEALLALVRGDASLIAETKIRTRDGWYVEPWVLMTQIINHATEHREQIKSMLTSLGVAPPEIDGWSYGEVTDALVPAK